MSKFKVGDKVVVNGYRYHERTGFVTEVFDQGCMVDSGKMLVQHAMSDDNSEFHLAFLNSQIAIDPSNTLQVGKTYTSENGSEWECIFIRDGKAWMLGVYPDGASGSAYDFDIDGTASWAGGHGAPWYNIKWGPKRVKYMKMMVREESGKVRESRSCEGSDFILEFEVNNGTPDWTTAKVTPCV